MNMLSTDRQQHQMLLHVFMAHAHMGYFATLAPLPNINIKVHERHSTLIQDFLETCLMNLSLK